MSKRVLIQIVMVSLMLGATCASAAPLIGTGIPGPAGTLEGNWEVTPVLNSDGVYAVNAAEDYPDAWVNPIAFGLTASWISPFTNADHTLAVNDTNSNATFTPYTYTLADFAGPGQDVIIQWASDNGARFFLNGVELSTILAPSVDDAPFASLVTFVISAGVFDPLSNIFEVLVTNLAFDGANPTGLLVDITVVPLPPAVLLFGSGLIGLGWLSRRRGKRKALPASGAGIAPA